VKCGAAALKAPLTDHPQAVHFGGGNIGRGFVAEMLHNSGYEVVFVDVMDSIIEALQNTKSVHPGTANSKRC
jgi:mannitol-1-phosphate/altronate dehydrogenase